MKNNFEYIFMGMLVGIILFMSIGFWDLYNRVEYLETRMSEQIEIANNQSLDIWELNSKLSRWNLYWTNQANR